ncbi:MAG TPA: hypothetical protein PKM48_06525, partial [Parvularculaceae bacterium]|nr:hypothetical protein [Parvularculaceae bacterium]
MRLTGGCPLVVFPAFFPVPRFGRPRSGIARRTSAKSSYAMARISRSGSRNRFVSRAGFGAAGPSNAVNSWISALRRLFRVR